MILFIHLFIYSFIYADPPYLWFQLKAGDIVKLEGQQIVPADMLLVFTSMYADGKDN
jgi:hypothetical protein